MRQLCTESPCPYSGRSVRPSDAIPACLTYQSGSWLTTPGRAGALPAGASERGSRRQVGVARQGVISGVTEQKSAEAILAAASREDVR